MDFEVLRQRGILAEGKLRCCVENGGVRCVVTTLRSLRPAS